jgi:hypothetical protein
MEKSESPSRDGSDDIRSRSPIEMTTVKHKQSAEVSRGLPQRCHASRSAAATRSNGRAKRPVRV